MFCYIQADFFFVHIHWAASLGPCLVVLMGQGFSPLDADFWSSAHTLEEALVQLPWFPHQEHQMGFVGIYHMALYNNKTENYWTGLNFQIFKNWFKFQILESRPMKWKQGWHGGQNIHLPPMWPEFNSQTCRHMWVKFQGFFFGFSNPVFLSPQKATLQTLIYPMHIQRAL